MLAEGRDLAKHFGCKFIETSAKQRINVDEAFCSLVREIRRYNKVRSHLPPVFRFLDVIRRSNKPVARVCSQTHRQGLVCMALARETKTT